MASEIGGTSEPMPSRNTYAGLGTSKPMPSRNTYAGLVAAAMAEQSGILPDQAARLQFYRERHAVSDAEHDEVLAAMGQTNEEYEVRCAKGDEVQMYLTVVAVTLQEAGGAGGQVAGRTLELYRERHGVSEAVHAAAMRVLGLPVAGLGSAAAPAAAARDG